jgi:hypothetical protein
MPFKSKAQRRKFAELLLKGEISPETYEDWNRDTGSARLPERVTPAKKGSRKATKASKRRRQTKAPPKTTRKTRKPKRKPTRRSK